MSCEKDDKAIVIADVTGKICKNKNCTGELLRIGLFLMLLIFVFQTLYVYININSQSILYFIGTTTAIINQTKHETVSGIFIENDDTGKSAVVYDSINISSLTLQEWQQFNIELKTIIVLANSWSSKQADTWTAWPIGVSLNFIQQLFVETQIEHQHSVETYVMLNEQFNKLRRHNHSKTLLVAVGGGLYRNRFMRNLFQNGIENNHLKDKYLSKLSDYKFQISPEGNGVDCYRHYESLLFGVIPIINTKYKYGIIEKYGNVPILWTHDYSDINESYLLTQYNKYYKYKEYDFSRLLLEYYSPYEQYMITDTAQHWMNTGFVQFFNKFGFNWYSDFIDPNRKADSKFNQFLVKQVKYPYAQDIEYISENEYMSILSDEWFYYHNQFYDRYYLYYLDLRNIQNGPYDIQKNYFINTKTETIEYRNTPMNKFGNGLSVYWGIRSLAYWSTYNFIVPQNYIIGYMNRLNKSSLFTHFLPVNITIRTKSNRNQYHTKLLYPKIGLGEFASNIHPTSMLFMYYNPYFQKIINYEMTKALDEFYKTNTRKLPTITHFKDIVIHIRCGDVIQGMWDLWPLSDYGFLTMSYYKYAVKYIVKHEMKITPSSTVHIISQLTNNSLRTGEQSYAKYCNYLIDFIINHDTNGFKKIFYPAKIKITYDFDQNDDYFRMINAPILFCSPSSFCFNAALANINGIVIMPSIGPWLDLSVLRQHNDTKFPNYNYIYGVDSKFIFKTELLPSNNVIIETNKSGFHFFQFEDRTEKTENLSIYTQRVAQYLAIH
eukprot:516499_1